MPFSLHISEPHPTYSPILHTGRGGAGNKTRSALPPSSLNTPGHSDPITTPHYASHYETPNTSRFSTGRGGKGNFHSAGSDERQMFHFDEELETQRRTSEAVPVYHVGRGGSGNAVVERSSRRESSGSESSDVSSRKSEALEWVRGLAKRV